jgi:DNA modification methylase
MVEHIGNLKPDKRNARRHTPRNVGMIEHSIQANGFGRSVLLANDGTIIAGNATIDAAASAGLDDVLIVETDGTKVIAVKRTDIEPGSEQFHRLALSDNRAAELAEWEPAIIAQLNDEMDLSPFFYDDELTDLLAAMAGETEGLTDPDAVPEPPVEPTTKPGDLWRLGRHRLLCGDCRDFSHVERLFGDTRANVVITSPPYASQRKYDESSGFKPIRPDDYVEWFRDVAANVMAILADDGSYFLNIKEHADEGQRSLYVKDLAIAHVRAWGWQFVDEFCWRNTRNGVPGTWPNRFKNAWEPVFHFSRQEHIKFYPRNVGVDSDAVFGYHPDNGKSTTDTPFIREKAGGYHKGKALPSNVIEVAAASTGGHSAPFPVELPVWFIRAFSDPDDVIYDPFMGSGTTLVASEQEGRIAYGTEISPAYCDVIIRRFEEFSGLHAELITDESRVAA